MAQNRQWVVDLLRHAGYRQAAEAAAQELPDPVTLEQVQEFADRHGISRDEIVSQLGGSP
jgi:hypothetical protein